MKLASPDSPCYCRVRCHLWLLCLMALAVSGCQVGPDYDKPGAGAPGAWGWDGARSSARLDAAADPDPKWWKELGDADLERAVRLAVRRNADLEQARQRARKARSMIGVAESRLLPSLGGGGSYTRGEISENLPILEGFFERGQINPNLELYSAAFDAGWEIDIFGGARRSVQAASARAEAAEAAGRHMLLTVVAETARNYFILRQSQAEAAALEHSIALQEETIKLARDQRDAGTGAQLDVERSRAQLGVFEAKLPGILAREAASAYRLAVLTGQQPDAVYRHLSKRKPLPAPPDVVPTGLPGSMLRRRPDVARAERLLEAATAEVGVNVARLYPRFSLTGVAGRQATSFTDLYNAASGTWMIAPGIQWAAFDGGSIRAAINASEAGRKEALAAYRATILEAVAEAEGALTRYARAFEARNKTAGSFHHLEQTAKLASDAYDAGVVSFFEVLAAQRHLAESRQQLAAAQAEVLIALASLNKALGGGWPLKSPPR